MLATPVGIDRLVEMYVRRLIPGNDSPGLVLPPLRAQRRRCLAVTAGQRVIQVDSSLNITAVARPRYRRGHDLPAIVDIDPLP